MKHLTISNAWLFWVDLLHQESVSTSEIWNAQENRTNAGTGKKQGITGNIREF
jgi:hypothetical protein